MIITIGWSGQASPGVRMVPPPSAICELRYLDTLLEEGTRS